MYKSKFLPNRPRMCFSAKKERVLPGASSHEDLQNQLKNFTYIPKFNKRAIFNQDYFQRKGSHFDLDDKLLKEYSFLNMVTGANEESIIVNEVKYNGPVVVTKDMVFIWEVESFEGLTRDHFKILDHLNPIPKYAIISTGTSFRTLPNDLSSVFDQYTIKVDSIELFQAVGTYNIAIEQGIETVGFFWLK